MSGEGYEQHQHQPQQQDVHGGHMNTYLASGGSMAPGMNSHPHQGGIERHHPSSLINGGGGGAMSYSGLMPQYEMSGGHSAVNSSSSGMVDPEVLRLQALTAESHTHEQEIASREQQLINAMGAGAMTGGGDEAAAEAAVVSGEAQAEGDEAEDEANKRSVYVGNVDYGVTPHELQDHFVKCGKILRVTILVDKFTGHPKGYAYIEFSDPAAANTALMLANTTLRGRPLKVVPKRKNIAGLARGRGAMRGAGRGRGAPMYYGAPYMGGAYGAAMTAGTPFVPRGGPYRPIRSRGLRRPRGTPY